MSEYAFDMHFLLPGWDTDPESYLGRLLEEGCDDSTVGIGRRGHIVLMFDREAPTATDAVLSAVAAVKRAIPGAVLAEIGPDLVGFTDVAELLGCSRQNVRQLVYDSDVDPPDSIYSGRPTLWHLADLLTWLRDKKRYPVAGDLIDLAETNRQINLFIAHAKELPAAQDEIRSVLA